jgi:hypothetical protein
MKDLPKMLNGLATDAGDQLRTCKYTQQEPIKATKYPKSSHSDPNNSQLEGFFIILLLSIS